MTSTSQILGSWVRIPLDAWMADGFFCVRVVLCRQRSCDGLIPLQGFLRTIYKIENFRINSEWEQAREPNPSR
jgi:hypothetical protein